MFDKKVKNSIQELRSQSKKIILSLIFLVLSFSLKSAFSGEVEMGVEKLHWLGHASLRYDGEKIIYFDPWKLAKNSKKADIIFISHEHYDHFSKEDLTLIGTSDTVIITDRSVAGQLADRDIIFKEVKRMSPGENYEVSGIKIKAVPAYNINKEFHTKKSQKTGFVVDIGNLIIYQAGDTDKIPEMADVRCDIALLPVGGIYTMNAQEAAQATLIIKPKIAIPIHYGDIVGFSADGLKFAELLKGKVEVKILKLER